MVRSEAHSWLYPRREDYPWPLSKEIDPNTSKDLMVSFDASPDVVRSHKPATVQLPVEEDFDLERCFVIVET